MISLYLRNPGASVQLCDQGAGRDEISTAALEVFCIRIRAENLMSWPMFLHAESAVDAASIKKYSQIVRNIRRVRRWHALAQAKKTGISEISKTLLRVNDVYVPLLDQHKKLKIAIETDATICASIDVGDLVPLYRPRSDVKYCYSGVDVVNHT